MMYILRLSNLYDDIPDTVTKLIIEHDIECCDKPLNEIIKLPDSIKHIIFKDRFNYPIDDIKMPIFLETIKFGDAFNQPIHYVDFPDTVQSMIFGFCFNQPIHSVKFPIFLQNLTFGHKFNQILDHVKFPNSLPNITIRNICDCYDADTKEARTIQYLELFRPLTNLNPLINKILIKDTLNNISMIRQSKLPFECNVIYYH